MVLEKDSSILGYPGEISKSLNADHHQVCKFNSTQDSNYISVRNALKTLVNKVRPKGMFRFHILPNRMFCQKILNSSEALALT
jgi:hypothetical protein